MLDKGPSNDWLLGVMALVGVCILIAVLISVT